MVLISQYQSFPQMSLIQQYQLDYFTEGELRLVHLSYCCQKYPAIQMSNLGILWRGCSGSFNKKCLFHYSIQNLTVFKLTAVTVINDISDISSGCDGCEEAIIRDNSSQLVQLGITEAVVLQSELSLVSGVQVL